MKYRNAVVKYAGVLAASTPVMAFAQTAQPDTSDAITYIGAGVATVLAVWGGKYLINGAMFVARKVGVAIGR